jgi:hypothetical protein
MSNTPNLPERHQPQVPAQPSLAPRSFDDLWNLSQVLSKSTLVPASYRSKPENIVLAAMAGQPYGWNPVEAINNMHIIDGTPSIKPLIMLAMVRQAGHSVDVKEATPERVVLVGKRRDTGDTATVSYTAEDAKRANLLGRGNWKTYPEDMLMARAGSRLCRRLFQDVTLAASYVPEELGAEVIVTDDGDQVPVIVEAVIAPSGVAAKDVKNAAYKALVAADVERDAAIAAVAAAWDATDHADADIVTDAQAAAFAADINKVIASLGDDIDDAEIVDDIPSLPADDRDPFAIDDDDDDDGLVAA